MAMKSKFQVGANGRFSRDGDAMTLQFEVWETDNATLASYLSSATNFGTYVADASAHLLANVPGNIGLLFLDAIALTEDEDSNSARLMFNVNYTSMRIQRRWGHDTTGGTLHITNSFHTTRYARSGYTAINYGGNIGMTEDGPEGVERVIPALRLNCRFLHDKLRFAAETDYLDYTKTLASLTGTTNNASIFNFNQGELLFMGSTGECTPGYEHEFDYTFLASANASGLTIAQVITGVAKEGHDYLWLEYRGGENGDGKWVPTIPVCVHVERIYNKTNFSLLEIGS
jgi:hypothetical protein